MFSIRLCRNFQTSTASAALESQASVDTARIPPPPTLRTTFRLRRSTSRLVSTSRRWSGSPRTAKISCPRGRAFVAPGKTPICSEESWTLSRSRRIETDLKVLSTKEVVMHSFLEAVVLSCPPHTVCGGGGVQMCLRRQGNQEACQLCEIISLNIFAANPSPVR